MLRYVENVGGFGFDNEFVNTALEAWIKNIKMIKYD